MTAVSNTFASIAGACEAINRHDLNDGEFYKIYKVISNTVFINAKTRTVLSQFKPTAARKRMQLSSNSIQQVITININYIHVYRIKQALLTEIEDCDINCFALFPAYLYYVIE